VAELLFWPALIAYGEAAVAYAGNARNPGGLGRLATWGVRVGWIVQTALLAAQLLDAEGFPWASWAGSLNLFVWLVVSAYLIWGCKPSYRLLGLTVMPVAAILLAIAYAGGGMGDGSEARLSTLFLALHVGFVLAGVAGFTIAAGLSALYLWEERRLKRREPGILRAGAPSLVAVEALSVRVATVALALFAVGMAAGLEHFEHVDARMVASILTGTVFAAFLLSRRAGLRGRRPAWIAVAGFALVLVVLGVTHF
jgi:ABC-type uncharacterized transport system permease subunit